MKSSNIRTFQIASFGVMLMTSVSVLAGAETGWHGEITGLIQGTVNGPGRFFCIDSMPMASGRAPATLVIADGGRAGRYGVTFSLPRNTGSGKHPLVASTVWDIGKVIQVRVDARNGNAIESFGTNPDGFLSIEALPDGLAGAAGKEVRGLYEVRLENTRGESIHVSGSFKFSAPAEISADPRKQWYCKDPIPQ
jgi:hypothetical protein